MSKKSICLIFATAIISGLSIFLNSYAVQLANPTIYAFLRNLVIALIMSAVILTPRVWPELRRLTRRQWIWLVLIGLIGGSVAFWLFFTGLSWTGSVTGTLIHKTLFIWVAILAPIILREKIKLIFIAPAVALLAGNFLLLSGSLKFSGSGMMMILAATILWAGENIISKHVLNQQVKPLVVIWARMFFGALFLGGILAVTRQFPTAINFSWPAVYWLAISCVLLMGYMLTWYYGLARVPVTLASTILLLGAPVTTALAFVFQGKTLVSSQILGLLLIILGTAFAIYLFNDITKQIKLQHTKPQDLTFKM